MSTEHAQSLDQYGVDLCASVSLFAVAALS
jgi:hypothetical protein